MATNTEQLEAAFAALYENNHSPDRLQKLVSATIEQTTDAEAQAKFAKNTVDLNANQKAFFVLERLRASVRATIADNAQRKSHSAERDARAARRQAVRAATTGF